MEIPEGMVAVVQGLPDAALTVSLLDGSRQYTLVPNAAVNVPAYVHMARKPVSAATEVCQDTRIQTGAQAVDGRYASIYQMSHCNVLPTSPPVQLTEFPPQRTQLCPGQGNFEVGGLGSGETSFSPTRANGSFRGAMNWPDRGSVFSPRASHEPDAFAKSLRKYPALSPERSSEVVERLINYSQKNLKTQHRNPPGCSRSESNNPSQVVDRRNTLETSIRLQGVYDFEADVGPRGLDESPTRDNVRKYHSETFESKKSIFGTNCDVRYVVDLKKRVEDDVRHDFPIPYSVCEDSREHGHPGRVPPATDVPQICATHSVHIETQAEVPMVSKEVATVPRERKSTRNVAISLSPTTSRTLELQTSNLNNKCSCKSIQTAKVTDLKLNRKQSIQTCLSSIDLPQARKKKDKNSRRSKSQEELRINDDIEEELYQLVKGLKKYTGINTNYSIRNGLLKKLKKLNKTNRNDRLKIKFGKCIMEKLYLQKDFKYHTTELSKEAMSKIKGRNMLVNSNDSISVFRSETDHCKDTNNKENLVDNIIKEWFNEIPMKSVDYLGRNVDKKQILKTVSEKIKSLFTNIETRDTLRSLNSDILNIIENIPVEVDARNKMHYFKRIVCDLIEKIDKACSLYVTSRKKWERKIDLDKMLRHTVRAESLVCQYVQPTENELKQFVSDELNAFANKFHLKICTCTAKEIEIELIDILIDSIDAIRYENEEQVRNEILILMLDLIQISQQQAIYFANNLIYNLKDMFKEPHTSSIKSQAFLVLRNSLQNVSMQTQSHITDYSIEGITDEDIQNNLDLYTQEIVQEINEWMSKLECLNEIDAGFKQVVAHDLAGDIVDRHKYLEFNPMSKGSDADELEHLKYQIFKWVNKLVGEDNLETIKQAPKLMQKIRNIPMPMLTKPIHNINPNKPLCCQTPRSSPIVKESQISKGTHSPTANTPIQAGYSKDPNNSIDDTKVKTLRDLADQFTNKHRSIQIQHDQIPVLPEKKIKNISAYTNTDIPKTHPHNMSLNIMSPPREEPGKRRFSLPVDFPPNAKTGIAIQTPNIYESKNASTSYSNPVRVSPSKSASKPSCCHLQPPNTNAVPTLEQLNEKYDEFLRNWVQQVPIHLPTPDQALDQKLRLGLYNGIWKAITKIKMNPAVFSNPFYYQDLLDDELEDLLNCLPSTPELDRKKQALKSKLVEETTDITQQIINTPSSFKQQLVDNISINLPKLTVDIAGQDCNKICEDIHKLILAEDFIMLTMYKEDDQVKANVYKKKLMKHIQQFIESVKNIHGKELKDIEFYNYRDEILNSLYKVPLPSDDTIKSEADEILLGIEIEQWFADLPLHAASNYCEVLNRKRYIDTLARKIHDMEKQQSLENCEDELRQEITRFIAKLPLRQGAVGNTQFMVEELVNRLKNRTRDVIAGSGVRRKSVTFGEPSYDEFSRNMPMSSSFSDSPDAKKAQVNQSSFMVVGGERADDASFPCRGQYIQYRQRDNTEPQEWLSLLELTAPPVMFSDPVPQPQDKHVSQKVETCPNSSQKILSQLHMSNQTHAPSCNVHPSSEPQALQGPSCCQPMGGQSMIDQRSLAHEPSFPQPNLYTSRQTDANLSRAYPGAIIPDQRSQALGNSGYQVPGSDACSKSCSLGQLPTPTAFGPEGSTRPYGSSGPAAPQPTPDYRQYMQRSFLPSPDGFSKQPIGFSTPQWNCSPPRESRHKKMTRHVEKSRRDAAKKRLDLEDSDEEDSARETRCRCMERFRRSYRRKRPYFCEDCEMDLPPCYPMRYPYPCYY